MEGRAKAVTETNDDRNQSERELFDAFSAKLQAQRAATWNCDQDGEPYPDLQLRLWERKPGVSWSIESPHGMEGYLVLYEREDGYTLKVAKLIDDAFKLHARIQAARSRDADATPPSGSS